jgi:hypothetical protein
MAITPVASSSNPTSTSCPHCGAAVHADQRYCLSCGQPCSPVRLAFLDVLRSEHGNGHAGAAALPGSTQLPAPGGPGLPVGPTAGGSVVYMRPPEQDGILGWLQRRAGALALASMLLLVGLIGLLVGHWITGTPKSGPQEVRVVYPNGVPLAQAGGGAGGSAATSTEHSGAGTTAPKAKGGSGESEAEREAKEVRENQEEEKKAKALPAPTKQSSAKQKHIESLTGRARAEAAEQQEKENPGAPIESGG